MTKHPIRKKKLISKDDVRKIMHLNLYYLNTEVFPLEELKLIKLIPEIDLKLYVPTISP